MGSKKGNKRKVQKRGNRTLLFHHLAGLGSLAYFRTSPDKTSVKVAEEDVVVKNEHPVASSSSSSSRSLGVDNAEICKASEESNHSQQGSMHEAQKPEENVINSISPVQAENTRPATDEASSSMIEPDTSSTTSSGCSPQDDGVDVTPSREDIDAHIDGSFGIAKADICKASEVSGHSQHGSMHEVAEEDVLVKDEVVASDIAGSSSSGSLGVDKEEIFKASEESDHSQHGSLHEGQKTEETIMNSISPVQAENNSPATNETSTSMIGPDTSATTFTSCSPQDDGIDVASGQTPSSEDMDAHTSMIVSSVVAYLDL